MMADIGMSNACGSSAWHHNQNYSGHNLILPVLLEQTDGFPQSPVTLTRLLLYRVFPVTCQANKDVTSFHKGNAYSILARG